MLLVSSYLETFCHYQTLNGVVLRSRYWKSHLIRGPNSGIFPIRRRASVMDKLLRLWNLSNKHKWASLPVTEYASFKITLFRGETDKVPSLAFFTLSFIDVLKHFTILTNTNTCAGVFFHKDQVYKRIFKNNLFYRPHPVAAFPSWTKNNLQNSSLELLKLCQCIYFCTGVNITCLSQEIFSGRTDVTTHKVNFRPDTRHTFLWK